MMETTGQKVSVLLPTLNAGPRWAEALDAIQRQTASITQKIIIDSGSADSTVSEALRYGFQIVSISKKEFNHGRVRQQLADLAGDSDICVYLTQDAILSSDDSIEKLLAAFTDPQVGLAYGRQYPHRGARPLEAHARLFNYHDRREVRSYDDKDRMGFKVFFCSNSFAAYRKQTLDEVGGFPVDSIMGEDAIVSAKMLLAGHKVAYVADAGVYHSHTYNFAQEFRRYFDTRVFHEQNKWLIENYGKPTGEGMRYIKSELRYVLRNHPPSLFSMAGSSLAKILGYSAGRHFRRMPRSWLRKISMHGSYWE